MKFTKYGNEFNSSPQRETSRRKLEPKERAKVAQTFVPDKAGPTAIRVLRFIHEYIQTNGFAPAMREIGAGVGLKSTATINTHVCTLVHHGLLVHNKSKPRAYGLTALGLVKVQCEIVGLRA